jgi:hypothetical protein
MAEDEIHGEESTDYAWKIVITMVRSIRKV